MYSQKNSNIVVRPEKRKQREKKSLKTPTLGRFCITAIYCKSRCQGQPEKTLLITQAPLKKKLQKKKNFVKMILFYSTWCTDSKQSLVSYT